MYACIAIAMYVFSTIHTEDNNHNRIGSVIVVYMLSKIYLARLLTQGNMTGVAIQ